MRGMVRRGSLREVSEEQVWEVDRTSCSPCPEAEVDTSAQTRILAMEWGLGSQGTGDSLPLLRWVPGWLPVSDSQHPSLAFLSFGMP